MRLRHLALPAAAGLTLLAIPFAPAAVAAPVCDPEANSCAEVFQFTGGLQTFTVPAGVTNLIVALGGAAGGNGLVADGSPAGGSGGAFEAIVPVAPGETLSLVVGGKGGDASTTPTAAAGGYGGGGAGTAALDASVAGGGGGSFVFNAAGTLLVAAGGGGGAGLTRDETTESTGGNGGGSAAGEAGAGANGGGGATTSGGGTPGAGDTVVGAGSGGTGPATSPTAFGVGGAATGTCAAGGGGGGYFGGGSGGCTTGTVAAAAAGDVQAAADTTIVTSGGGGGGAGFVGNGSSQVAEFGDVSNGNDDGVIAIGYTTAQTTATLTTDATTLAPGQEASLDATIEGTPLVIGEPTDADSPAGATAAAAFGAQAAALAVPTQPAPAGTTVDPGTACGTTPCTVTFFVNGTALGDPIPVDPATGVANVVFTAGSESGVRSITARYDGNLYYLQSTSNAVAIDVNGLANTGVENVAPMLGSAAALLVVGAGLVAYGRRRPQLGSHRAA